MTVDEYLELPEGTRVFCYYPELTKFPEDGLQNYDLMLTDYKIEPVKEEKNIDDKYYNTFSRNLHGIFPWFKKEGGFIWAIIIKGMRITANLVDTRAGAPHQEGLRRV